jgi:asparagine synthase (glutamine-hydrolysing)
VAHAAADGGRGGGRLTVCGLAGFLTPGGSPDEEVLEAMTDTLVHRGPDDSGLWIDARAGVALGHTRLAVVDLSPQGHQPMVSASGRYVIAYNGEIYNHRDLRMELKGLEHAFRGHSDTEVLLAACEAWGPAGALERVAGMFAFALWDREAGRLLLARDRMGEKPLYHGWMGGTFLFASEPKALTRHPDWKGEIDRGALALFLRHNYVPAPYSIYRGIAKLPPGRAVWVDPRAPGRTPEPVAYWSVREAAEAGMRTPFEGDPEAAADELEALLRQAVRGQMVADVPLGVFLSGGIDSSTVVALMQAEARSPVRSFTIGFHEAGYDEAPHARRVAEHLGTDHTELYVGPEDALKVVPELPRVYAEPFADVSQIPTLLLCRMARQHVTVALSGDGGDELFHGYPRYNMARAMWGAVGHLPGTVKRPLGKALAGVPEERWERGLGWASAVLDRFGRAPVGAKAHALATFLDAEGPEAVYRRLVSHWADPAAAARGAAEHPTVLTDPRRWADLPDLASRVMFWDMLSYLPDDVLVKVDRASMAVALETREPLLDHRVVEFAWRLPLSYKVRAGRGKWLLRRVLHRHVPPELVERPKAGFAVPIGAWLRGPLRDWGEALLDRRRLEDEGYLDAAAVRRKWEEHVAGRADWRHHLWDVLMFQAWLEDR